MLIVGGGLYGVMRLSGGSSSSGAAVSLTCFDRRPEVRGRGSKQWQPLDQDRPIVQGDEIRTQAGAHTGLRLDASDTLRIGPHSQLAFTSLTTTDGAAQAELTLDTGRVWVDRGAKAAIRVHTDAASVTVEGRQIEVLHFDGTTRVRAWNGTARVVAAGAPPKTVKAMHEMALSVSGALKTTPLDARSADAFVAWNRATTTAQVAEGRIAAEAESEPQSAVAAAPVAPPQAPARPARPATPPPSVPMVAPAPSFSRPNGSSFAPPPGSGAAPSRPSNPTMARAPGSSSAGGAGAASSSGSSGSTGTGGGVRSSWQGTSLLSRQGLPDLRNGVNRDIPMVNGSSQTDVQGAFTRVSMELSTRLGMTMSQPCSVTLDAPGSLSAPGGVDLWVWVESPTGAHVVHVLGGQSPVDTWSACVNGFARAWYDENYYVRSGHVANDNVRERAGFAKWCEGKFFMALGVNSRAADYLDPNGVGERERGVDRRYSENVGLEQMLSLEKQYGEYGVLYYITHGTPPE